MFIPSFNIILKFLSIAIRQEGEKKRGIQAEKKEVKMFIWRLHDII